MNLVAEIARNRRIGYAIRIRTDDGIATLRNGLYATTVVRLHAARRRAQGASDHRPRVVATRLGIRRVGGVMPLDASA